MSVTKQSHQLLSLWGWADKVNVRRAKVGEGIGIMELITLHAARHRPTSPYYAMVLSAISDRAINSTTSSADQNKKQGNIFNVCTFVL